MLPHSNPCTRAIELTHDLLTDRVEFWVMEVKRLFIQHQDNPEALDQLLLMINDLKTIILNLDSFTEDLLHSHEYLLHESAGTMDP